MSEMEHACVYEGVVAVARFWYWCIFMCVKLVEHSIKSAGTDMHWFFGKSYD
jgi:hypothetical protein